VARLLPIPGAIAAEASLDGDPFGRIRLFDALVAVLGALARGTRPRLLWIDHLQLADPSTLEFLGYAAHRLADHPLGLLLAWRAEDLEPESRDRLLTGADGVFNPGAPRRVYRHEYHDR